MLHYNWNEFKQDLDAGSMLVQQIVPTAESLRSYVVNKLSDLGVKAEFNFVGSTDPRRLTTIIDPRTPHLNSHCDFDLAIVLYGENSIEEQESVVEAIFPHQKIIRKRKEGLHVNTSYKGFRVDAGFMNESNISHSQPLKYSALCNDFPAEVIETTRALRLVALREGLYGGFTRGLKGIDLERIAQEQGHFDYALSWLGQEIKKGKVVIPSLLDESNLVRYVQQDIWDRAGDAADFYKEKGKLKMTPFVKEEWLEYHSHSSTFCKVSKVNDEHVTFQKTEKWVKSELKKHGVKNPRLGKRYHLHITPNLEGNQILLAVNTLSARKKPKFSQEFMAIDV
jgi:hypothetical protein